MWTLGFAFIRFCHLLNDWILLLRVRLVNPFLVIKTLDCCFYKVREYKHTNTRTRIQTPIQTRRVAHNIPITTHYILPTFRLSLFLFFSFSLSFSVCACLCYFSLLNLSESLSLSFFLWILALISVCARSRWKSSATRAVKQKMSGRQTKARESVESKMPTQWRILLTLSPSLSQTFTERLSSSQGRMSGHWSCKVRCSLFLKNRFRSAYI